MISLFLLLFPNSWLEKLGLVELVKFCSNYRLWIILAFLISIFFLLGHLIVLIVNSLKKQSIYWLNIRHGKYYLKNLTPQEKEILKRYIDNNTQTCYFDIRNGIVGGLTQKGILIQSTNFGTPRKFAYNIQPWAYEYLKKYPKLLE